MNRQQYNNQPQMQPQLHPQMQPQLHPQIQPQLYPQIQPQTQPQIQPQIQQKMNLLFYSTKCDYCHELIRLMKNEGIISYFRMICVDGNIENIPKTITQVPAILTTDTNKIYLANEAFKWLQGIKYMRQKNLNKKIIEYNIYKNMQVGGPHSFISSEMNGISDNFAYTNIDMAQPKTFQDYGKDDQNVILTPPKDTIKINSTQQNKKLKEIELAREQQSKLFNETMKQEQIKAVIKAQREKLMPDNYKY